MHRRLEQYSPKHATQTFTWPHGYSTTTAGFKEHTMQAAKNSVVEEPSKRSSAPGALSSPCTLWSVQHPPGAAVARRASVHPPTSEGRLGCGGDAVSCSGGQRQPPLSFACAASVRRLQALRYAPVSLPEAATGGEEHATAAADAAATAVSTGPPLPPLPP